MLPTESAGRYRRIRVRRSITLIAASLIGGAVVTTGIAWWFAWTAPAFSPPGIVHQGIARYRGAVVNFEVCDRERGVRRVILFPRRDESQYTLPPGMTYSTGAELLPSWSVAERFEGDWKQGSLPELANLIVLEMATGWPWPTMVASISGDTMTPMEKRRVEGIALTARTPNLANIPVVLPITPLWLGFAASTSLVSVVLSAPAIIGAVKIFARKRRGGCVRCGYDLRRVPTRTCPECGLHDDLAA